MKVWQVFFSILKVSIILDAFFFCCPTYLAGQPQVSGKVHTYALVYGINYTGKKTDNFKNLNYANDDADLFNHFLHSTACGIPDSNILCRKDNEATINQFTTDWSRMTDPRVAGDTLIFYFAGHGVTDGSGNQYLLLYDVPGYWQSQDLSIKGGAISMRDFNGWVDDLAGRNVVVILVIDACRESCNHATPGRIPVVEQNSNTCEHITYLACGRDQKSMEGTQWGGGHGAFTYYLVKGLEGFAEHYGNYIRAGDLASYVSQHVKADTRDRKTGQSGQAPLLKIDRLTDNGIVATFDIALIRHWDSLEIKSKHTPKNSENVFSKDVQINAAHSIGNTDSLGQYYYRKIKEALAQGLNLPGLEGAAQYYLDSLSKTGTNNALFIEAKNSIRVSLLNDGQKAIDSYLTGVDSLLSPQIFKTAAIKMQYALNYVDTTDKSYGLYQHMQQFLYARYKSDADVNGMDSALIILKNIVKYDTTLPYVYHVLGRILFLQLKYDSAEYYTINAIKLAPAWKYPYNLLGFILEETRNYDLAIEKLNQALSLDSNYAQPLRNLGHVYSATQKFQVAIYYYKKSILKDPKALIGYCDLAKTYIAINEYDSAMLWARKAESIEPSYVPALRTIGLIYYLSDSFERAESYYLAVLAKDSSSLQSYRDMAFFYFKNKSYQKAIRIYQAASRLTPNDPYIYYDLGLMFDAIPDFDSSRLYYNKAIQLDSNFILPVIGLGKLYRKFGKDEMAYSSFVNALKIDSNNPSALYEFGYLLVNGNDWQKGIEYLARAKSKNPVQVLNTISAVYLLKNIPDSARRYAELSLAVDSNNAPPLLVLGATDLDKGKSASAYRLLNMALKARPDMVDVWRYLALYYAQTGNRDSLLIWKKKILSADSTQPDNWLDVGHLLIDMGKSDQAISFLVQGIKLDDGYADLWFQLGVAYELQNRLEEGNSAFLKALSLDTSLIAAYNYIGLNMLAKKKYQDASANFAHYLRLDSMEASVWNNLGTAYLRDAKADASTSADSLRVFAKLTKAAEAFTKFLQLDTVKENTAGVYYNLASTYSLLHNSDSTLFWLKKAFVAGYKDFGNVTRDSDLDYFRGTKKFIALTKKYDKM